MQIFGFWGEALPEFVRLREGTPSVIACGDATFPKGTAFVLAGNFAALPRRPLGGAGERSEPEGVRSQASVLALSSCIYHIFIDNKPHFAVN